MSLIPIDIMIVDWVDDIDEWENSKFSLNDRFLKIILYQDEIHDIVKDPVFLLYFWCRSSSEEIIFSNIKKIEENSYT